MKRGLDKRNPRRLKICGGVLVRLTGVEPATFRVGV